MEIVRYGKDVAEMRAKEIERSISRRNGAYNLAAQLHKDVVCNFKRVMMAVNKSKYIFNPDETVRWCPTYREQNVPTEKSTHDSVCSALYVVDSIKSVNSDWVVNIIRMVRHSETRYTFCKTLQCDVPLPGVPSDSINTRMPMITVEPEELPTSVLLNLIGKVIGK